MWTRCVSAAPRRGSVTRPGTHRLGPNGRKSTPCWRDADLSFNVTNSVASRHPESKAGRRKGGRANGGSNDGRVAARTPKIKRGVQALRPEPRDEGCRCRISTGVRPSSDAGAEIHLPALSNRMTTPSPRPASRPDLLEAGYLRAQRDPVNCEQSRMGSRNEPFRKLYANGLMGRDHGDRSTAELDAVVGLVAQGRLWGEVKTGCARDRMAAVTASGCASHARCDRAGGPLMDGPGPRWTRRHERSRSDDECADSFRW